MQLKRGGIPESVLDDVITLQGTEIVRLKDELNDIKTELERCKSELQDRKDLQEVTQELRALLQTGRDNGGKEELRQKLANLEALGSNLRVQLKETQKVLLGMQMRNDSLLEKLAAAEASRLKSEELLAQTKSSSAARSERLSTQLEEADSDIHFLEAGFEDIESRACLAEREHQWAEDQLVASSRTIKELLDQLSDQQAVQAGLEAEVSSAFNRGASMNRWMLRRTQDELTDTKIREAKLVAEIAGLQRDLAEVRTVSRASAKEAGRPSSSILHKTVLSAKESPSRDIQPTSVANPEDPPYVISGNDSRSTMVPGGVMEDMFQPLSKKVPDLQAIGEILGVRNAAIVVPDDFVWASCPDAAFFVKPALVQRKGSWKDSKTKSVKRLQRQGSTELLPYFSGACYYVGTYTVGDPEPMSMEEFGRLPEKTQRCVINASGKSNAYSMLRELYLSGKLTAIKFPVCRIGFNTELHRYLRATA